MSLTLKVYCKNVTEDMIPKIMERLNEFDMVASIHPAFKFDPVEDAGFLPFKFRLLKPRFDILKDKELKSGFEFYMTRFDLETEKDNLKPQLGFFDKLIGKKQHDVPYAPPDIEARLMDCKVAVSFVWHGSDSFALRFASLTSAVLTELTNGVCSYEDETWYENQHIAANAFEDVTEYEQSLTEAELDFMVFDEW